MMSNYTCILLTLKALAAVATSGVSILGNISSSAVKFLYEQNGHPGLDVDTTE
jgi:hypothetical protein